MKSRMLSVLAVLAALIGCSKSSNSPTSPNVNNSTNHNPTVNVNTTTAHLAYGGTATITASGTDVDGDQVTFVYTATGGSVTASGPTATTATFTAGTQWGPATVTVTASDGKGGSGQATATMYIRNPNAPVFVLEPVGTSSCGYGTANPDGFTLRITSPENVVITDIDFGPRDCGACGMDRNYYTHPISLNVAQQYVWSDGGCWTHGCCVSQGCSSCGTWSIVIAGTRPEPDGGSFYYTCSNWDQAHPTNYCH